MSRFCSFALLQAKLAHENLNLCLSLIDVRECRSPTKSKFACVFLLGRQRPSARVVYVTINTRLTVLLAAAA